MITTKITPSSSFTNSFDLNVYSGRAYPLWVIPCHNHATAAHLSDLILNGDPSEPEVAVDSSLTAKLSHGSFFGSFVVSVFNSAGDLVNEIPCGDIRTARHYLANPTTIQFG